MTRILHAFLLSILLLPGPLAAADEKPLPADLGLDPVLISEGYVAAPLLVAVAVTAGGEPIEELLREQHIQPDGDALAVVYRLNPDLASLDKLPPGRTLTLPAMEGGADGMAPGAFVRVRLAPVVKRELLAIDSSLGPIVERVNLLPVARFEGADEKEDVVGGLDEIRGFLALLNTGITGGKLPLPPEVLHQTLAETRLVKAVLEAFVKSGKPLPAADRERIVQISEEMNLRAGSFDEMRRGGDRPPRWRDARVVVRLKGKEDGAPVSGLRVYYVPRVLSDRPEEVRRFDGLGPEVAARLPEASYLVWAGVEGNPKPLSPQARVDVRRQEKGKEVVVELPVPRGRGGR